MTENEAISELKMIKHTRVFLPSDEVYEKAIKALEEIQQYRAIGTVEECQNNKVLADKRYEHFFDGMELLEKYKAIGTVEEFKMLKDHLWTLNEICKDYSAIGTVEEFKRAKEMEAVYGQVKWERDIAISQLEEIGVGLGQKMDEFKALKEKSIAKKAEWKFDDFTATFGKPYRCSNCDEEFEDTYNYCPNCGCDMYAD